MRVLRTAGGALLGLVLGGGLGALLVYGVTWFMHWNTYGTRAEFWGDVLALIAGAPIGGVIGAIVGSILAFREPPAGP